MKTSFAVWMAFVLTAAHAQDSTPKDSHQMHRLHQDPKAYVAMLEAPSRDAYQKPMEVIQALQIRRGETIADIGAGSGYFTFRLAKAVGQKGKIYAVDVSADMIVHLNRRIRDLHVQNVATILAVPEDPLLPDISIDRFFVCNTWHHIENHSEYLRHIRNMLKPGGQVVMVDFKKEATPVGPPLQMRIDRQDLVAEMKSHGFRVAGEHYFLPYQYFLIFEEGND